MAGKISAVMLEALQQAREHGGELERWPGGFWTWPGCPVEREQQHGRTGTENLSPVRVPSWHAGAGTIYGLISRGLMVVAEHSRGGSRFAGHPTRVRLAETAETASATRPVSGNYQAGEA